MLLRFIIGQIKKLITPNGAANVSSPVTVTPEDQDPKILFIKKWWRPTIYVLLAALIIFHGFILPISKGQPVDLSGLSLLITAVLGVF